MPNLGIMNRPMRAYGAAGTAAARGVVDTALWVGVAVGLLVGVLVGVTVSALVGELISGATTVLLVGSGVGEALAPPLPHPEAAIAPTNPTAKTANESKRNPRFALPPA